MRHRFSYTVALLCIVFMPQLVFASTCSSTGFTVEYINGVSNTLQESKANLILLQKILGLEYKGQPLSINLAYNADHVGGVGSVAELISQMLLSPISDYDFHTVLAQMAVDDTTRKLVLFGHSQGALYANSMYGYVTSNGEPARSVDVYAMATPASYVAGGGKYITSAQDAVIYATRALAQKLGIPAPLPANVSISGNLAPADLPQTHFFPTYIDGAGDRIVRDIDTQLDELQSQPTSSTTGCFTPPAETTADRVQQVAFAVADPVADLARGGIEVIYQTTAAIISSVVEVAQASYSAIASATQFVSASNTNPAGPETQEKNFVITKKLYGSSIDQQEYAELNTQGSAVITAVASEETEPASGYISTSSAATTSIFVASATSTSSVWGAVVTTATSTAPVLFLGGSALPPPSPISIVVIATSTGSTTPPASPPIASTTPPIASSTPSTAPTNIFTASTTPPSLTVAECANSLSSHECLIGTTTATLSWTATQYAVQYGIIVDGIQTATTSALQATTTLTDQTTAEISIIAYDMQNASATSSVQSVAVAVPVPHPILALSDTFDNFKTDTIEWQTFGHNEKIFDFDDNTDGECFKNGCIVGMGGNIFSTLIPRVYVETQPALFNGAFSIYAKARSGFNNPDPTISICQAGSNGCLDQAGVNVQGITFLHAIPLDDTWHQYYFAWQQGSPYVQSCIMEDDIRPADCVWVDTTIMSGTKFDGVAFWSGNSYRSDVAPNANLWFDELQAQ